jgi:hypothetical protein
MSKYDDDLCQVTESISFKQTALEIDERNTIGSSKEKRERQKQDFVPVSFFFGFLFRKHWPQENGFFGYSVVPIHIQFS